MALLTRLARLVRADLHAVLDRLEEPGPLLAQALREMEDALNADAAALAALERRRQQLAARRAELAERQRRVAEELEVCLDAGADDLTRALLRRRLADARLDAELAAREQDAVGRIEVMRDGLAERRQRYDALRAEAALYTPDPADDDGRGIDDPPDRPLAVSDADVEIALLAERHRRSR